MCVCGVHKHLYVFPKQKFRGVQSDIPTCTDTVSITVYMQ